MATGYSIQIGYMSGDAYDGAAGSDLYTTLRSALENIVNSPDKVLSEILRIGDSFGPIPDYDPVEWIQIYLSSAWHPGLDDSDRSLFISASGSGESRDLKEKVARAVCRMIMEAMHQRGIEVSIMVG